MKIIFDGKPFPLETLERIAFGGSQFEISSASLDRIRASRAFVESALSDGKAHYGINTGFGRLAQVRIDDADVDTLQLNIIRSHAAGVGEPLPAPIVRLMIALRANVLCMGYSGVRVEVVEALLDMLHRDLIPVIPSKGSVGASGDLAPLAHLALALIGEGEIFFEGCRSPAREALKKRGMNPLVLKAKEGLALVNGTQAMTAVASWALIKARNLALAADIAGALSLEGERASPDPFDARLHALRPHVGQSATASNIRTLIEGSELIFGHGDCGRVQDPYSFRCIPQVHGACKDLLQYAAKTILCESGSCTDNPLIFAESGEILSGGNFHGEPLAFAADAMCMALAELGNISERRVAIFVAPFQGEMPTTFLTPNPGLNSGYMIPQVTMSALVAENKILCHPASVDSIPTSGGQEDHVSMGMHAARKALEVASNLEHIISIEMLAAAQAIDLQKAHGIAGKGTKAVYDLIRQSIPFAAEDRAFGADIACMRVLLTIGSVAETVQTSVGSLSAFGEVLS